MTATYAGDTKTSCYVTESCKLLNANRHDTSTDVCMLFGDIVNNNYYYQLCVDRKWVYSNRPARDSSRDMMKCNERIEWNRHRCIVIHVALGFPI